MELDISGRELLDWFLGAPVRILVILVIALFLQRIASRAITKTLGKIAEADFIPGEKNQVTRQRERARTAASVLNSSSKALVGLISGAMILGELGVDLGPLVTPAGVVGFAVGLGAQSIVRDIFSGITMLIEEKHPELSKFLLEMPVTIPDVDHPRVDDEMLQNYYQSLCDLLKEYEIEHPF